MKGFFLALLPLLLWSSNVNAQTPFYEGKTLLIVVGSAPGGPFDSWARLIAQHMGKYIPGNPKFIVQNMPGGGSMIAANYVYNVAKPDGLTLGSVQAALYLEQLAGRKEVQFDWAKFAWIGNPESVYRIFFIRADTPYKTLEDIRKASEPPRCGSQAAGTVANYFPRLLEDALGLKLNIVTGYKGAADIRLAIERGEVHCYAFSVQGFFTTEPSRTWGASKRTVLEQFPDGWASTANEFPLCDLTPSPKYEAVVSAFDGYGESVEEPSQLLSALRRAIEIVRTKKRTVVLNVICAGPRVPRR